MLLFMLWATLFTGVLVGSGYSHYRYRVRNNQYYERLFARNREEPSNAELDRNTERSRVIPILVLVTACALGPLSLVI